MPRCSKCTLSFGLSYLYPTCVVFKHTIYPFLLLLIQMLNLIKR